MAVAYIRTVSVIYINPGFVTLGPQNKPIPGTRLEFIEDPPTPAEQMLSGKKKKESQEIKARNDARPEKPRPGARGRTVTKLDREAIFRGDAPAPRGTEKFYSKDVFQCDPHGLPIWCGTCNNWKPDRAHHCSDIGRCVMKLDHYCPWYVLFRYFTKNSMLISTGSEELSARITSNFSFSSIFMQQVTLCSF